MAGKPSPWHSNLSQTLVVLDLSMPVMNGLDAAQELKRRLAICPNE